MESSRSHGVEVNRRIAGERDGLLSRDKDCVRMAQAGGSKARHQTRIIIYHAIKMLNPDTAHLLLAYGAVAGAKQPTPTMSRRGDGGGSRGVRT